MNLIDFFDKSAELTPERDCVVFDERRWSYRATRRCRSNPFAIGSCAVAWTT